jgi:hypothetical protein
MQKRRRFICSSALLILFSAVSACKVSDDAVAASSQMTSTAAGLNSYYSALANSVTDTIALYELDSVISGIPFNSEDRKLPEDTRSEILKRGELANSLGRLASSMATLSASKSPADVETAATSLGNELIQVKALPGGSPVPDAIGKAGNYLLQVIHQHKEKEAARAVDQTLAAVGDLFEKEKPTYDSIARTHLFEANQVAKDLTNANGVDPTAMLSPALKPFNLTPLPATKQLQDSLKSLALSRLQNSAEEAIKKEVDASSAMLTALREMSTRIHLLATERPMPIRGNPFSLKLVESWAASAI